MKDQQEPANNPNTEDQSCEQGLSREEFLKLVVKGLAIAGAVTSGPRIVDKFLVPPVYAIGTRMSAPGSASDQPSGYGTDTSVIKPTM